MLYDIPEAPYKSSRETYFAGVLLFTCSLIGLVNTAFDYPLLIHVALPAFYLYLIYSLERKCPNEMGNISYLFATFINLFITFIPVRIISTSLLENPDAARANWGTVLALIITSASLQKILTEARLRSIGHQKSVKYISSAIWVFTVGLGILTIKDQIDPNLDAIDKLRAEAIGLLSVPLGLYLNFVPSKTFRARAIKYIWQKKDGIDAFKEGSVWWYAIDGERKGTISRDDLKDLFTQNQITPETLVWKEGMDGWERISNISALSTILSSVPPPLPNTNTPPDLSQESGDPAQNTEAPQSSIKEDNFDLAKEIKRKNKLIKAAEEYQ